MSAEQDEVAVERQAVSACVVCQHRAIWHHDERGCQYHGNGSHRCPCRRTSDQVVARIVYEAISSAAVPWFDQIAVDHPTTPTPAAEVGRREESGR